MRMVRKAELKDSELAAELALKLWPENLLEELKEGMDEYIRDTDSSVWLQEEDEKVVGFAQCQLRYDYVEGTESSPVGYLEGLYVDEAYRRRGIASQLIGACEAWARNKGCTEFASDCELHNEESLKLHLNFGFEEANRIICFTKKL